ncbi:MAG: hypothetical protein NTW66_03990 [Candidatus Magasanikbacteria bacterium]|nr:hypothetical protein [Candidatus Magasanikbacteria bacterium]
MPGKIIIIQKCQRGALFSGLPYAQVVVNEACVGEQESGHSVSYGELASFLDKITGITDEERERAKQDLRTFFKVG